MKLLLKISYRDEIVVFVTAPEIYVSPHAAEQRTTDSKITHPAADKKIRAGAG
jgi:hypothetical protein